MPSVSRAVSACASRWLTAIRGLPNAAAMALAVVSPTSTPPISPGPAVAATASTSLSLIPALAAARSMMWSRWLTWARAASSGTTPP